MIILLDAAVNVLDETKLIAVHNVFWKDKENLEKKTGKAVRDSARSSPPSEIEMS